MIKYHVGNLLKSDIMLIVHSVNAQGKMKSGVAKVIRETYPNAYTEYMKRFEERGLYLGDVIFADCGERIVANAVTQQYYGYDGSRYVDYEALRECFKEINTYASENDLLDIGLPKISADRAGGSWEIISKIISEEFTDTQPHVFLLTKEEFEKTTKEDHKYLTS